ncbi:MULTISPECIES: 3-hydroxyacyl-ACP dehydratase FabZ family protein [unclassified Pseudomonas]|uniref:3-hydroxyacyl-ACP dehydratase FabZ family protein n=1 Tax=unclassified Pseudomonas TaxID=196821 RepID=UPI000BA4087E|nr:MULTISPECIES: 3-hydroxyacyl-ACP dehydratase FabZ family protein [unclassified Pseudomonas]MCU1723753.1 beta-hydroxyacyl-ACP dehydratase [Pseudomonas sp. 5P_5.1_Bac1]MCU1733364.1 beta-hydroxyacyl-ACP dehydratase [Pseudomonas sp. 20P_3.2_Bac4]MCU1743927.1 beta-hydroxyacyl-ACP dehydratase [Pseudomonas sp. 20P_3.2_Bac5]
MADTSAALDVTAALARLRRGGLLQPTAASSAVVVFPPLEQMLPHRSPFLLLDRVQAWDPRQQALLAQRRVDPEDPVLAGHFPGNPIYPGALQGEAIAQAGQCLLHMASGCPATPLQVLATRVFGAQFLGQVRPGEIMDIEVRLLDDNGMLAVFGGRISVEGAVRSVVVMEGCRV